MPVKRLLLTMSWPMMLSMLIQALYNMVDSIFVAQLSGDAFVALGLAYPVQLFVVSVCVGTGVGFNSLLSRRLGEQRQEEAESVAIHGYVLYFLTWLPFLFFALFLARPFIAMSADSPAVVRQGTLYLSIVTGGSIGICMQFAGERLLQASGNAVGPMIIQGVGAVINLILDPIFIFGLGPVPAMGVAGAALATVLGQWIGMGVSLWMTARNRVVRVSLRGFRFRGTVVREIYRIGVPAIVMQSLSTFMIMGLNQIATRVLDTGVFILTAYFKLQSFLFMPVFGMTNALVPIVGYNYGARSQERVHALIRFALTMALVILTVGGIAMAILPVPLLSLFHPDSATLQDGVSALRMIACSFPFAGVSIIFCSSFQALGAPMSSLVLSLLRQIILLLPLALLLSLLSPIALFWAFPLAELLTCLAALLLYRRVNRTKLLPLGEAY